MDSMKVRREETIKEIKSLIVQFYTSEDDGDDFDIIVEINDRLNWLNDRIRDLENDVEYYSSNAGKLRLELYETKQRLKKTEES